MPVQYYAKVSSCKTKLSEQVKEGLRSFKAPLMLLRARKLCQYKLGKRRNIQQLIGLHHKCRSTNRNTERRGAVHIDF